MSTILFLLLSLFLYFTPYEFSVSLLCSFIFSISPFSMSFSPFLSLPSFLLSSQHYFCHSAYNLSLSISFSSTFVSHHFLDFFNANRSLKHTHKIKKNTKKLFNIISPEQISLTFFYRHSTVLNKMASRFSFANNVLSRLHLCSHNST